jgi:Xaa-Pro aminopeptidase
MLAYISFMFQGFEDRGGPAQVKERVARLRSLLATEGYEGVLVPRADAHQGEYVAERDERLAWLTGFTGSAGLALVLQDRAALFVDGRYTLQLRAQTDTEIFQPVHTSETSPERWFENHLHTGERIAFDPWLHTANAVNRYRESAGKAGAQLIATERNLIDMIWPDQPPAPLSQALPHPLIYAGEPHEEKMARIATAIGKENADAAVLTLPESLAWLFNIRGRDVRHTPLAQGFALMFADGHAELFMDERKLPAQTRLHLGNRVILQPPDIFAARLAALGREARRVVFDPTTGAEWVRLRLEGSGAHVVKAQDPCLLPKARKNAAEQQGTRAAHIRDGAALTSFLAWLAREAPKGNIDEISAAEKLERFRRQSGMLRDVSFDSISGAGAHGAIVHYRVSRSTNSKLKSGDLYLIDSGAQYEDGTTDVTRTIAIGTATAEERERFTRVLKGHIALAAARFPVGTTGAQLDVLARLALWKAGLDYDHGTGHGVGSYLAVHEGPQGISRLSTVALEPGMIISNEPGYYREGRYGIRIENLVLVTPLEIPEGGERPMLGFETLTLAPIDRTLIDAKLLTAEERDWLDAYHGRVRDTLSPLVDAQTRAWLTEATAPIGQRERA